MRLVGQDDNGDGLDIDLGDADTQELEVTAYRFSQILPDPCEKLAKRLAYSGINHPVVFLCDVADPFGLAIAKKVSTPAFIEQSLKWTSPEERPGVISGLDMDSLESKELTIFEAIWNRMDGLFGYFPIVVAAKGGFSVFPYPYKLKEKSKFKLFPLSGE